MENNNTVPQPPKDGHNTVYIKKSVLVVIGVIAFIALSLTLYTGYRLWTQNNKTTPKTAALPSPAATKIKEAGPEAPKVELLKQVPPTATENEKKNQEDLLMTNKRDTAIVFIGANCKTSPTVANLVGITKMKFNNEDEVKHTITIDAKHSYGIEPDTFLPVELTTFQKNKFYSYTCDNTPDTAGYIYIPQ